ncbi:MAG: restriction endonuclease subunit R, partial [Proteobacteria bacterium]|nr:restriction endonuclease subunit R [Pseudomonadota bacterium]
MPAPKEIIKLVKRFDEQKDSYLKSGSEYGETEVRTHFINPFFEALGWSMDNSVNASEIYMDVIHEAKVLVNGSTKAPDYSFGIATHRRFFVEAKRPSVNIENNHDAAFQARSYGWSGTLPICILTNFNYFIVYNTTIQPHHKDKLNKARVEIYHYTDYLPTWDEIESRFSRQAVISGKFDEFATKPHKGTETIDNVFLAEIEEWREKLAKDIYKNNPKLPDHDLNTAVQHISDRIIFLRICEDRGIETESTLQNISTQPKIYDSLKRLFQDADDKYNSGLFHFNKELEQKSVPDKLTLNLKINDPVFQSIFKSLYPPSPYAFSVMPADILGQIYERFLGKVIRLTPKQVKIEDKPQVRKAGGVYYTPSYIVNYIVKNTIGDLLKDSTPAK